MQSKDIKDMSEEELAVLLKNIREKTAKEAERERREGKHQKAAV